MTGGGWEEDRIQEVSFEPEGSERRHDAEVRMQTDVVECWMMMGARMMIGSGEIRLAESPDCLS